MEAKKSRVAKNKQAEVELDWEDVGCETLCPQTFKMQMGAGFYVLQGCVLQPGLLGSRLGTWYAASKKWQSKPKMQPAVGLGFGADEKK